MTIEIEGKTFCFSGAFSTINKETGKPLSRKQLAGLVTEKGGVVKSSVLKTLDYLVVGSKGSDFYSSGSKGNKILKAENQPNTSVITEEEFIKALEY